MNVKTKLLAVLCSIFCHVQAQQWKTYTPANSALPFSKVYTIAVDSDDWVWMGTNVGGNVDTGMAYLRNDSVFAVGPNTGLIYSIYAEKNVTWFLRTNYLMKLDINGWSYPMPDPSLGVGMLAYADPVVIDAQQQLWMKPMNGGLLKLVNNTWSWLKTTNSALPTDQINDLCTWGNALWMATQDKGLVRHENGTFTSFHTGNSSIGYDTILKLCKGRNGNLWMISRDRKLIRFDGTGFTSYASPDLHAVTDLLEDRDANVWIATSHGLYQFHNGVFTVFNAANSAIGTDNLLCLEIDSKDNLWIGTFGNGLSVYNKDGVKTGLKKHELHNDLICIYPNPVTDKLHIMLKDGTRPVHYTITDLMGHTWEMPAGNEPPDVSGLSRGMYILEVRTEHGVMRKQFFRQ